MIIIKRQSTTLCDELYCIRCSNKGIPIMRKKSKEKPYGHLKRLWCPYCKIEFNHVQCNEFSHYTYEDFLYEKENGNFDEKGNRILSYGEFKTKMNKIEQSQGNIS